MGCACCGARRRKTTPIQGQQTTTPSPLQPQKVPIPKPVYKNGRWRIETTVPVEPNE